MLHEEIPDSGGRHPQCFFLGIAVPPGEPERFQVRRAQQPFTLRSIPAAVDRSRRVDDILCGQVESGRKDCSPRRNGRHLSAGSPKRRHTRRLKDRAANASAHLKFRIGSVDNGIHLHLGDVLTDDGKGHDLASFQV